jgi:putative sterol carrier protein
MSAPASGTRGGAGDATTKFFERLADRGYEPLLERTTGSVRVDLVDGSRTAHWLVSIDRGHVVVSRDSSDADAVLRADPRTFDDIVTGRSNTVAAVLRGVVDVEGDPELVVHFRRIFPGPRRSGRKPGRVRSGAAS